MRVIVRRAIRIARSCESSTATDTADRVRYRHRPSRPGRKLADLDLRHRTGLHAEERRLRAQREAVGRACINRSASNVPSRPLA
jgi:hypothetical protein